MILVYITSVFLTTDDKPSDPPIPHPEPSGGGGSGGGNN